MKQTQRKCRTCERKTLHVTQPPGCLASLVAVVVSLGLLAPFVILAHVFAPWRCQLCGKKN